MFDSTDKDGFTIQLAHAVSKTTTSICAQLRGGEADEEPPMASNCGPNGVGNFRGLYRPGKYFIRVMYRVGESDLCQYTLRVVHGAAPPLPPARAEK